MEPTGSRQQRTLWEHLLQIAVVGFGLAVVASLASGIFYGLKAHNIPINFDFLTQSSNLHLTEGFTLTWNAGPEFKDFASSDNNLQAFILGLSNTLKVAFLGILFSTILGLLIGVGRVSKNWIVNRASLLFVELIRNTPLLV
ncbi:MAG: ABC transporter permease subunit, partial [Burkholderiaceae bacterium]